MSAVPNPFKSAPPAAKLVLFFCFRVWNRGLRTFNFPLPAILFFSAETIFAQPNNAAAEFACSATSPGMTTTATPRFATATRIARPLGARQSLFVVAYEQQRFLIATSPAGVNLVSHLPDAEAAPVQPAEKTSGPMPFAQALQQVLKGK